MAFSLILIGINFFQMPIFDGNYYFRLVRKNGLWENNKIFDFIKETFTCDAIHVFLNKKLSFLGVRTQIAKKKEEKIRNSLKNYRAQTRNIDCKS